MLSDSLFLFQSGERVPIIVLRSCCEMQSARGEQRIFNNHQDVHDAHPVFVWANALTN